jgi:hypothetical protein
MRIFARDAAPPADVVARAGLPGGERILAATCARDGHWLLATRRRLVMVPPDGPVETVGWEQVEAADWSRDEDRLRVSQVGEFGLPRGRHELTLHDAGDLLAVVRERVTASVVLQRRVVVRGKQGLTVVARRAPNTDDPLSWSYELDPGLEPDDPVVRDMADQALRAAAEELGL